MKKLLSLAMAVGTTLGSLSATSVEYHLEQLDKDLNKKVIGKYIPRGNTSSVISLAMEEDMDANYQNHYLLSDEMLSLMNKDGVLGSSFATKIEAFQNFVDSLSKEEQKLEAIGAWKTLWLDKVSEHQLYLKGLKKLFTYDVTQSLNYDSNIKLESSDDAFSGADDVGGAHWCRH